MPVQGPQWSEYLSCPVCKQEFEVSGKQQRKSLSWHLMCKAIATGQQCLCNRQQRSHQCHWHAVTRCAEPAWTRCRCASARSTAPSSASPALTRCPSTQLCSSSSGVARCQPGAQSHIPKNPNLPHPGTERCPQNLTRRRWNPTDLRSGGQTKNKS